MHEGRVGRVDGGPAAGDERALRSGRHDHGVLDHLRLHQAEDLGPVVLGPVGRADPAPRHAGSPQVQPLHDRREYKGLHRGPRQRQELEPRRVDLQGEVPLRAAVRGELEVVGPHDGGEHVAQPAQDAVLVEAGGLVDQDRRARRRLRRCGRRHVVGVETGVEAGQQRLDELRAPADGVLDVALAERHAGLTQVPARRADDADVPPADTGGQHQPGQAVQLRSHPTRPPRTRSPGPRRPRRSPAGGRVRRRRGTDRCRRGRAGGGRRRTRRGGRTPGRRR